MERSNSRGRFALLQVLYPGRRVERLWVPGGYHGEFWIRFAEWLTFNCPERIDDNNPIVKLEGRIAALRSLVAELSLKLSRSAALEFDLRSKLRKKRKRKKGLRSSTVSIASFVEACPIASSELVVENTEINVANVEETAPVFGEKFAGDCLSNVFNASNSIAENIVAREEYVGAKVRDEVSTADSSRSAKADNPVAKLMIQKSASSKRRSAVVPLWQRNIFHSNKLKLQAVCEAWDLATEASRSFIPSLALADPGGGSQLLGDTPFEWPFWDLDNTQLLNLIKSRELRKPIVGIPDELNNLRSGSTELHRLLLQDDVNLKNLMIPAIISLGPLIHIHGGDVHLLTLLKRLHCPEDTRANWIAVYLWKNLIGKPVMSLLRQAGFEADLEWCDSGIPCAALDGLVRCGCTNH